MDGCTVEEGEIRERLESGVAMAKKARISLKAKLKKIIKQRTSKSTGTDTLIRNSLTASGIYFENYHGGSLNGNNCQRLCAKAREVTDVCKNICLNKLLVHERNNTLPTYSPSTEDCRETFEDLAQILEISDVVFSKCNILSPSESEQADLEDSISILEQKWHKADLPVTPKAHLTFRHLLKDIKLYDGLGDKQEQELERMHQVQKKWSHRFKGISNKSTAISTQYSYEWCSTHPRVEEILRNVSKPSRKRKGTTLTMKEENEQERVAIKQQRRDEVVCRLAMDMEDDNDEGE